MNENTVIKRSYIILLIGITISLIVSILLKSLSYVLGYIFGYIISLIVFKININISDFIIKVGSNGIIIYILFIIKLLLYALGLIVGIKTSLFNIFSIFIGYLTIKISIYIEALYRGGK